MNGTSSIVPTNGLLIKHTMNDKPAPLIQMQSPPDGIIRLPRGPDGTNGFTIRR